MKRSGVILLSTLLNLVLLAIVARQTMQLRQRSSSSSADDPGALSAARVAKADEAPEEKPKTNPPPKAEAAAPAPVPAQKVFDWRQVESEDYHAYIANLRKIGCPQETIHDIVRADVLQAFAGKRAEVMAARYHDFKFWKTDPNEVASRGDAEKQRAAVDEELRGSLRELIGEDLVPAMSAHEWRRVELEQQLGFLPSDKRGQTEALLLRDADIDTQIRGLADGYHTPENPNERRRVLEAYEQKRATLTALLTPEEYEQLDMTVSWTADNLRHAMEHFQPTEDEFRAIFRAWREHDEQLARLYATGQSDPGNTQVFDKIKQALGDKRYEEYRAAWWKRD